MNCLCLCVFVIYNSKALREGISLHSHLNCFIDKEKDIASESEDPE